MDNKPPLKTRFYNHRPRLLVETKGSTARRGIFRPSFWQLLLVVILVLSHELVIVQLRPSVAVSPTNNSNLDNLAVVLSTNQPESTSLTILQRMASAGPSLAESFKQQTSFQAQRNTIRESFPRSVRFQSYLKNWAANIIDEQYAYLHIFKVRRSRIVLLLLQESTSLDGSLPHWYKIFLTDRSLWIICQPNTRSLEWGYNNRISDRYMGNLYQRYASSTTKMVYLCSRPN
jgi:hypothetical protein